MEALENPPNWSAVASKAFASELAAIISKKGAKVMEDVVMRLRASKQKLADDGQATGFAAGQRWARDRAEAQELILLEEARGNLQHDWDHAWDLGQDSAYGPDECFVFTINPESDGDRVHAGEFWEVELDERDRASVQIPGFVKGFAEGALDVWADVKNQI